jgi:hypothetical protein
MQIGIDSFEAVISDLATGLTLSPVERMDNLLDEIVLADQKSAKNAAGPRRLGHNLMHCAGPQARC